MVLFPNTPPLSTSALNLLSENSKQCINRLAQHSPDQIDLSSHPTKKLAAVLVLLYEREGKLRVLLTTRSKLLRSHPGETALPGGKVDDTDDCIVLTAYREAYEEVALPIDSPQVHTITTLRPFLSSRKLFVTPIVSLCTDLSIIQSLNPSQDEVSAIFDHPLQAFLDPTLALDEHLVPRGSEDWPYDSELHHSTDVAVPSLGNSLYRMNCFRGTASPITGLTADIMIYVSEIAYGTTPNYEHAAYNQLSGTDAILQILQYEQNSNPGSNP